MSDHRYLVAPRAPIRPDAARTAAAPISVNGPRRRARSAMPREQAAEPGVVDLFQHCFALELALTPATVNDALALRYRVYCEDKGYEQASRFPHGREHDEYDERALHALVRHRQTNEAVGTVRLVLPQRDRPDAPFPMEAACAAALPSRARLRLREQQRCSTAEISRFAIDRDFQRRWAADSPDAWPDGAVPTPERRRQLMRYVIVGLFGGVARMGQAAGLTHYIAALQPTLLRLLARHGINFSEIGTAVDYHGERHPVMGSRDRFLAGISEQRPDVLELMSRLGQATARERRTIRQQHPLPALTRCPVEPVAPHRGPGRAAVPNPPRPMAAQADPAGEEPRHAPRRNTPTGSRDTVQSE